MVIFINDFLFAFQNAFDNFSNTLNRQGKTIDSFDKKNNTSSFWLCCGKSSKNHLISLDIPLLRLEVITVKILSIYNKLENKKKYKKIF